MKIWHGVLIFCFCFVAQIFVRVRCHNKLEKVDWRKESRDFGKVIGEFKKGMEEK